ncbi:MAG: AraC family transcriptional regulator [Clostridia bacterium]|nr:AraC family transcriptional regulator [Clostridia bacterium]
MSFSTLLFQSNEIISLPIVFQPKDPIYVCDFGYHKTPCGHEFGPATRPYYLLHLIESGKGEIEREGVVTPLSAGEAFLICPDEVTIYRADKTDPWVYRWVSFNGTFAEELVKKTTDRLCMPYRKSGLLALQNALEQGVSDPIGSLNSLFTVLDSIKTQQTLQDGVDPIFVALQYLEYNYFQAVDIGELAYQLGFTRSYFSTLFLQKTGESPYAYLTKIRIGKAKEFLLDPTRTVEEIAYSTGYSSIQRFSEMFKKATGFSPLQYRKSVFIKKTV